MAQLLADGSKQIQLGKQQFADINSALNRFTQRTKCSAVLLADMSGLLLAQAGPADPKNFAVIATLVAANYAATTEMSKLLGESNGFRLNFYEGVNNNLYITEVDETTVLVVIFDSETTFGMIRVLSGKTAEELSAIIAREELNPETAEAHNMFQSSLKDDSFQEELSSRLDSVLSLDNKAEG